MKYFQHELASREDDKLWELIDRHGLTGYGFWWIILEELYKAEENGFQIEATGVWLKRLSKGLNISDLRTLPRLLDTMAELGLISTQLWQENIVFAPGVVSRAQGYVDKKEQGRKRVEAYRQRQKQLQAQAEAAAVQTEAETQPVTRYGNAVTQQYTHIDLDLDLDLDLNENLDPEKEETINTLNKCLSIGSLEQTAHPTSKLESEKSAVNGEQATLFSESLEAQDLQTSSAAEPVRAVRVEVLPAEQLEAVKAPTSSGKKGVPFSEAARRLQEVYNTHKGPTWATWRTISDNPQDPRNKALKAVLKSFGLQETERMCAQALQWAATDKFWGTNKFGINNLLADGRLAQFSENFEEYVSDQNSRTTGLSSADIKVRQELARRLERVRAMEADKQAG